MKKEKIDYISILKGIPGFDVLEPEQLKKIAAIVNIQEYHYGDFVFKESDVSDAFYVILHGKVKICVTSKENADMNLSVLGPMDSFGEIGFISGNPRIASVRVERVSKLLVIKKITKTKGRNRFWSVYFVNFVFCGLFIFIFIMRD